jgi:hypothetical protein
MAILTEISLEFAKEHITKYYDSDFFPKPIEFEALWYHWEEVKKDLQSRNVNKMWVTQPRVMAVPKPKLGFRVVHQLEPLDALIYTALAFQVAEQVEKARAPADEHIACSYRFNLSEGSFFAGGSGWPVFVEASEHLGQQHAYVLIADITDFYNQIYLHRLNNAIEHSDAKLKPFADDIEWFIGTLNNKSSQGVPVGPAASIVMSEAVLIDVDSFIKSLGVIHTRYVDDFRIFSDSHDDLIKVLERLTLYLYENHRLTLATDKTEILISEKFLSEYLHSENAEEKAEIFQALEIFNPYTGDMEEFDFEFLDETTPEEDLLEAAKKILNFPALELGLARSVIRLARRKNMPILMFFLVDNFAFFLPAINDVIIYFNEISHEKIPEGFAEHFESVLNVVAVDSQLVRFWIEWFIAQHIELLVRQKLRKFVFSSSNLDNQARAAITSKDIAWVRDHKTAIYNLGGWARRAILSASRVLPSDERKNWLKLFVGNSPVPLDRWVASWVIATT